VALQDILEAEEVFAFLPLRVMLNPRLPVRLASGSVKVFCPSSQSHTYSYLIQLTRVLSSSGQRPMFRCNFDCPKGRGVADEWEFAVARKMTSSPPRWCAHRSRTMGLHLFSCHLARALYPNRLLCALFSGLNVEQKSRLHFWCVPQTGRCGHDVWAPHDYFLLHVPGTRPVSDASL